MEEFKFTIGASKTLSVVVLLSILDYELNNTVVNFYNVFLVKCSLLMLISSYDSWQE